MSEVTFRPPTADDIREVAVDMRQSDHEELLAMGFPSPPEALGHSHRISRWSAAAIWEEKPVAIVGLVNSGSLISPVGVPWMLGTPEMYETGRSILTRAREVVYAMRQEYPSLLNYVWAENKMSVRWLKRLGFTIHPAEELPPYGEPFHRFEMRR